MIPLYKPYMSQNLPDLDTILHSGELAYGKFGKEFEKQLSSYVGVDQIITANSFNSAVLVALITLGIKPGNEVIASPMACLASNQPFVTIGAKVVWADVDPTTGTLDPDSVRKKITAGTKAIFHNHFCGYPGFIDEINSIGMEFNIPVVDDAIEAFGSEYKGKRIGNTGSDVTIFSFQAVRLPTTIDGGALVFKNQKLLERAVMVRDSGINRKYFRDRFGEIDSDYDITVPGFGATMSEINSYIGRQQINDIGALIQKQRQNASNWNKKIIEQFMHCELYNQRPDIMPNFWIYGILTDDKENTMKEFRNAGYYSSGVHFPNNYYSVFGKKNKLPGVDKFQSRFLALPSGWWFEVVI
jgi:perosamine synthetase